MAAEQQQQQQYVMLAPQHAAGSAGVRCKSANLCVESRHSTSRSSGSSVSLLLKAALKATMQQAHPRKHLHRH
jgi:hypothetical protein